MVRFVHGVLLFLLTQLPSSAGIAQTYEVKIDVGAYGGKVCINERLNCVDPAEVLYLEKGVHDFIVAPSTGFQFEVLPINQSKLALVNSLNTAAATGDRNVLSLNTTQIVVKPAEYMGTFWVDGVENRTELPANKPGSRSITVIAGLDNYALGLAPNIAFRFDVSEYGFVRVNHSYAAKGVGNSLVFTPVSIRVTPDNAAQKWSIDGAESGNPFVDGVGERTLAVLPDLGGYSLNTSPGEGLRFWIDVNGKPRPDRISVLTSHGPESFSLENISSNTISCQFFAELTIPKNDSIGSLLDLENLNLDADISVATPPEIGHAHVKFWRWHGNITITDSGGEQVVARHGKIYFQVGAPHEALIISLEGVDGSLGGVDTDESYSQMLFYGPSGNLGTQQTEPNLDRMITLNYLREVQLPLLDSVSTQLDRIVSTSKNGSFCQ